MPTGVDEEENAARRWLEANGQEGQAAVIGQLFRGQGWVLNVAKLEELGVPMLRRMLAGPDDEDPPAAEAAYLSLVMLEPEPGPEPEPAHGIKGRIAIAEPEPAHGIKGRIAIAETEEDSPPVSRAKTAPALQSPARPAPSLTTTAPGRAATSGGQYSPDLARTSTTMGHDVASSRSRATMADSGEFKLERTASASSGEFSPPAARTPRALPRGGGSGDGGGGGDRTPRQQRQQSAEEPVARASTMGEAEAADGQLSAREPTTLRDARALLVASANEWLPAVEFLAVLPLFRASWQAGEKDEDEDELCAILRERDLPDLLERLGYQHEWFEPEDGTLTIEEAMSKIVETGTPLTPSERDIPQLPWKAKDFKRWWLLQDVDDQKVSVSYVKEHLDSDGDMGLNHMFGYDPEDEVQGAAEQRMERMDSDESDKPKISLSRVIDGGGAVMEQLENDLGKVRAELRENVAAVRIVDNAVVNTMDRGIGMGESGLKQAADCFRWFFGAPAAAIGWMQKRVELDDDTAVADWWKIFVLQLISHCFPPLLLWEGYRLRVRKQYADESAEKAAIKQMKGQVVLQLLWWCTLVSLICLRAYDYLPSFVNSEIGLNCTLWLFLAMIRSEKEASIDKVPRDQVPTDLGTQFLGAVDQVTTDLDHDDNATVAFEGTPKFVSLSEKIARRRAANERLSVSEHRMHELKTEFISDPQWDTFRAFDFRHEYEEYLGDVLSDGAEGSLMEFFDEMVVALTPFAPKEFEDEFNELARPRPGDPANIQAPTYKGWPATKDGRYTDCLLRMRQGDVGYLRSRPSCGDDMAMRSDDVRVDLDRAEKMDTRLRECEARHEDLKKAQALLNRFAELGGNRTEEHAYGPKSVVLLMLVSAFCFWLGDESVDLALEGDDAVRQKLRNIKSDVLDSSNEFVSTLGFGSELFTWMAYFFAAVVMWMVWRLTQAAWRKHAWYCGRDWCDRQACWTWITCRSNRASEDEALTKKVYDFFSAGAPSDDPLLSDDDEMHGGGASRRVGINTDESSNIFPLAKYSSALSSPFPSKHKWDADQAKAYLLGHHDTEYDPEVREKLRKRSAMSTQEQNENPQRERCRNFTKMLKLDRKLDNAVQDYSKTVPEDADNKQDLVKMHRIQKLTEEVKELASKDIDIGSGTDAAQLAAEFDDLMQPPRRLTIGEAKLQLATWIDLQQWWVHYEFMRHVEGLKKECRHSGYKSRVHSHRDEDRKIPASLVARGIVGLSQAYAHKSATSGYYGRKLIIFIAAICAMSPYLHYLLLGCKEFEFLSTRECAFTPPEGMDFSAGDGSFSQDEMDAIGINRSTFQNHNGTGYIEPSELCAELRVPSCEDVEFCSPRVETRTCNPSDFELICHILAGVVEMSLVYTIFKDILAVLERFWMNLKCVEYFSQITPWPGMQSHLRFQHYGLLPTFQLSCPENVRAWNKIRIYCASFNKDSYAHEQLIVTYAFLLTMVATAIKIVGIFNGSVFRVADDDPEIVDTMAIKIIILQLLSGFFVGSILWTGMQTTRLQEHGLRHILMLSKAQHYHHAGTLYFSGTKNVTMLVPVNATIGFLQKQIERKLGIAVAHQRIDTHMSSAEDPRGGLMLRHKLQKEHERARDVLLKKKQALLKAKRQVEVEEVRLDQEEMDAQIPSSDVDVEASLSPGDRRRKRDKKLIKAHKVVKEQTDAFGTAERSQLAWLQDMQWRYDQLSTPHDLAQLYDKSANHLRSKDHTEGSKDREDNEEEFEQLEWLRALKDSDKKWPKLKTDDPVKQLLEASPRLYTSARKFPTMESPESQRRRGSFRGGSSMTPSSVRVEWTDEDAKHSIRLQGLRATTESQRNRIEEDIRGCFGGFLAHEQAIRFHPGKGGPFACWATVTFDTHKEAKKVRENALKFGLRGWGQDDSKSPLSSFGGKQAKACPWKFLPAEAQERWSSWLCERDPLSGSKGVLDVRRQTFSKSSGNATGITVCRLSHLNIKPQDGQQDKYLKYQVEVRDGQDIKLTKLDLDATDRQQKLDDGVLVVEWQKSESESGGGSNGSEQELSESNASGWDVVAESNSWRMERSPRDSINAYNGSRRFDRRGSDSSYSSIASESSDGSLMTESSIGSAQTSPAGLGGGMHTPAPRENQFKLEPMSTHSDIDAQMLTGDPLSAGVHHAHSAGSYNNRQSLASEAPTLRSTAEMSTQQEIRQDLWRRKEELGYMLDALADVMEEERIPPNLRHLPTVEDTRPTIEVPWYGPVPLTGLLFNAVLSLVVTGLGTTATAIYGSTLGDSTEHVAAGRG